MRRWLVIGNERGVTTPIRNDTPKERRILGRIGHSKAGGGHHQRRPAHGQGPAVGGAVDTERSPREHRHSSTRELRGEFARESARLLTCAPRPDHGDTRATRDLAAEVEGGWRLGEIRQPGRQARSDQDYRLRRFHGFESGPIPRELLSGSVAITASLEV